MKKRAEYEIKKVLGIDINLTAVRSGKSNGKPMTEAEFKKTFPKSKVADGKNEDGSTKFKMVDHPRLGEIWSTVEKELKPSK